MTSTHRGLGVRTVVSSWHMVSATHSSSGENSLPSSASVWGPSPTDFSKVSPSHGLMFFRKCSSMGSFHGMCSFRNKLLQCGSPQRVTCPASKPAPAWIPFLAGPQVLLEVQCRLSTGSQCSLDIHLLWCGVLHRLEVDICSMDCRGTAFLTIFSMGCWGIFILCCFYEHTLTD